MKGEVDEGLDDREEPHCAGIEDYGSVCWSVRVCVCMRSTELTLWKQVVHGGTHTRRRCGQRVREQCSCRRHWIELVRLWKGQG